ncbi:uncharacterized protein LOC118201634 [Stegodyphus dumicola]|uniref:uncharacterized protein LOC118201634 n=1 Tax=Stegodyphus dumicola TaxID=202533 RepID=UPI0015B2F30D|nr:uncharacterized protein LOC118201634 [Stegodyphus dumicola]
MGPKIDEEVGCALVVYKDGVPISTWKCHLQPGNTVFQAEALALSKAVDWLITSGERIGTIYSDSLSSIQAIKCPFHHSPTIRALQLKVQNAKDLHTRISWVKAHAGVTGNEQADELAKEAARQIDAEEVHLKFPKSNAKRQMKEIIENQWQQHWNGITQGRRTYEFLPKVSLERVLSAPFLTRYITGHGPFPSYFFERASQHPISACAGN